MPLHITFFFFTISLHIDRFLEVYIYAQVTFWVQLNILVQLWMFHEHTHLSHMDLRKCTLIISLQQQLSLSHIDLYVINYKHYSDHLQLRFEITDLPVYRYQISSNL